MVIIDMDLPKSCRDCPCGNVQDGWCYVHDDVLVKLENGYPDITKRPDNCPMREIPSPHGRLIDADEIKRKYPLAYNDFGMEINIGIHDAVNKAPTVIEADTRESKSTLNNS